MPDVRFCPLHGEYTPSGSDTACPACSADPIASHASLRRVRVVGPSSMDSDEPDSEVTQIKDLSNCPVCGKATRLEDFREEAIGEVWTGQAAVWAEEGVCADCYREVLPTMMRPWSPAEWLEHHFESWRVQVQKVHEIRVWELRAEESWLPTDEQTRIVDVAASLDRRREHLARSASAMKDLIARYPTEDKPPPFQAVIDSARAALNDEVVATLKDERAEGEERLRQRRNDSLADTPAPVLGDPPWGTPPLPPPPEPARPKPPEPTPRGWMVVVGLVVLAAVIWWLSR